VEAALRIAVTGSIAYDYLMEFPGSFRESLLDDRSERLTVSFLVESMRRMAGGVAGNVAYNLALLGDRPLMIGAAGNDFGPYRERLEKLGVDTRGVTVFEDDHTASCFINTDKNNNQLVAFYAGAMARSHELSLESWGLGGQDLAVISPTDPEVMMRYVSECQALGIPYVFDPGKQTPRLSAPQIMAGLEGAAVLVSNDYEFALMANKTGLTERQLIESAPLTVLTRGELGSSFFVRGEPELKIPVAPVERMIDPTGAGDAFLAGLLFGLARKLPLAVTGRVGSLLGAYAIEKKGCQEHAPSRAEFVARFEQSFGKTPELERALG
jgi:adenosine kinase